MRIVTFIYIRELKPVVRVDVVYICGGIKYVLIISSSIMVLRCVFVLSIVRIQNGIQQNLT